MNEKVWHKIMKNYVQNYNSIIDLSRSGILDEDGQHEELMMQLLKGIIETFRQEVSE